MKRLLSLFLGISILLLLCSCEPKEYYSHSHFKELETLSSVLNGYKLVDIDTSDRNSTIYTYYEEEDGYSLNNPISKYKDYLKKYGFSLVESSQETYRDDAGLDGYLRTDEFISSYEMDGYVISIATILNPVRVGKYKDVPSLIFYVVIQN